MESKMKAEAMERVGEMPARRLTDRQPSKKLQWETDAELLRAARGEVGVLTATNELMASQLAEAQQKLAAMAGGQVVASEDDLLEVARCLCSIAARRAELAPASRANYPHADEEGAPILMAARAACLARGYTEDGLSVEGISYPVSRPTATKVIRNTKLDGVAGVERDAVPEGDCSPLQFLHNVCQDVLLALRNCDRQPIAEMLEAALKNLPVAQPLAPSGAVPGYPDRIRLSDMLWGHKYGGLDNTGSILALFDSLSAQPLAASAVPEGLAALLSHVIDDFREMNPSNYTHDEACDLNNWGVEAMSFAQVVADQLATMPRQEAKPAVQAVTDVLAERQRQKDVEGWTPDHDDMHNDGQMAVAAGFYALQCGYPHERTNWKGDAPMYWPWAKSWWKPTTKRRNLVKAGALILAEIERIDRAAALSQQPAASPTEAK